MHLEIVPETIDGAVVCNVLQHRSSNTKEDFGAEVAIALHNWVKDRELPYLILDLQDEKYVLNSFLSEMMQLRRRLQVPLIFTGVLEGPRKVLDSYNYQSQFPFFTVPEDAVRALRLRHPGLTEMFDQSRITLGQPVVMSLGMAAQGDELEMADG